jgi:DNA-binding PadR family transcriptional regulator
MATNNVERITFMELKILGISKAQYDKGYSGGTFTPGLVRKETSYSYQVINTSLESLISHGLLEKTVTSTEREGVPVDLDAYSITDKGLQAIEKIKSGAIKIDSSDPGFAPPSGHEPRAGFRPEERRTPEYRFRPEERREPAQNNELAQSIKNLEATMKAITEDIKGLHEKADKMLAHVSAKPEVQMPAPQPKQRKPRALSSDALIHRVLVLDAVNELRKDWEVVLAKDVKAMYFKKCKERKLSPKGPTQFTTFLKRAQYERLLSLKRVGCRNLGIKGHGSRVVVEMTPEGEEFLAKHQQPIQHQN